jgi:hypothetical protein
VSDFELDYSKGKKQMKKSKNIKITNGHLIEISDYIDHVNQSLNNDYDYLFTAIRGVIDTESVDKKTLTTLSWKLTHLHTDMVNMHMTMKELQRAIREAEIVGKPLQD